MFEHGLKYIYEDRVFVKGDARITLGSWYKPDFTIFHKGNKFRLEHWGIDENDPQKKALPGLDWNEYRESMNWKRRYWKSKGETLIESSIIDSRIGREQFEVILKRRLEGCGIECERIPDKELAHKVFSVHRDRMTERFAQFIHKAKQASLSPNIMRKKIEELEQADARTLTFLELACDVFVAYQARLKGENRIDFDDLLMRAKKEIEKTRGDCLVELVEKGQGPATKLNDLRYVMIDEYQDFSDLFYGIVNTMIQYNPDLNVFAVGDDWQAINAFAGSDLKFFLNFTGYFDNAVTKNLVSNYRSRKAIVDYGNHIMKGLGNPSRHVEALDGGEGVLEVFNVSEIWLNDPNRPNADPDEEDDTRFFFERPNGGKDLSRHVIS